jgi:hypothetical protein
MSATPELPSTSPHDQRGASSIMMISWVVSVPESALNARADTSVTFVLALSSKPA